jgi:hypothetical protein
MNVRVSSCGKLAFSSKRAGWMSPHIVRFYRYERTEPGVRKLTMDQVATTMRGLAGSGHLEKRPRPSSEYRLPS